MKHKLFTVSTSTGLSTTATEYRPWGRSSGNASETARYHVVPSAGTFRNLRVKLASALSSGSWAISLYVNGSASTLTLTADNSGTTFSDTTHSVSVSAGDRVCIQSVPSSPNAAKTAQMSVEYESSTSNTVMISGCSGATDMPASAAAYYLPIYSPGNESTESTVYAVMPCAGTVKHLYVYLETAPGSTYTRTFAICKNGSTTGGASVTYTGSEYQGKSDTSTSALSIAQYDTLSIKATSSSASVAATKVQFGFVFQPTTDGQFVIPFAGYYGTNLSTTAARYGPLVAAYVTFSTAYLAYDNILGHSDFQITGVTAKLTGDPSPGQYAFDLRENDANSSPQLQVAVTSGNTTASASATVTPSDFGSLQWMSTPSSSPTARQVIISYIGYIAPTGGATPINASGIADDWNAL